MGCQSPSRKSLLVDNNYSRGIKKKLFLGAQEFILMRYLSFKKNIYLQKINIEYLFNGQNHGLIFIHGPCLINSVYDLKFQKRLRLYRLI